MEGSFLVGNRDLPIRIGDRNKTLEIFFPVFAAIFRLSSQKHSVSTTGADKRFNCIESASAFFLGIFFFTRCKFTNSDVYSCSTGKRFLAVKKLRTPVKKCYVQNALIFLSKIQILVRKPARHLSTALSQVFRNFQHFLLPNRVVFKASSPWNWWLLNFMISPFVFKKPSIFSEFDLYTKKISPAEIILFSDSYVTIPPVPMYTCNVVA